MRDKLLEKMDMYISETHSAFVYPMNTDKYKGRKPIEFYQWFGEFRPGGRADVYFGDDFINIVGTNAEGNFAGVKDQMKITDPDEMIKFKSAEGKIWFFV